MQMVCAVLAKECLVGSWWALRWLETTRAGRGESERSLGERPWQWRIYEDNS